MCPLTPNLPINRQLISTSLVATFFQIMLKPTLHFPCYFRRQLFHYKELVQNRNMYQYSYFVSTVGISVGNLNRYILFTHPQYNISSILPKRKNTLQCIVQQCLACTNLQKQSSFFGADRSSGCHIFLNCQALVPNPVHLDPIPIQNPKK